MSTENIISIVSIVIDIISLFISSCSLIYIINIKNNINSTDKSKVNNRLKNNDFDGDYIGRDKNG